MNHSFLTVRGLDYSIDGTEILQDVSLEVPEGTFVGLIGPNGCGKSTLLKNIYKTYRPQKDTVYIDGKDVVSLSAKEMARQAAVVAQENQTEFDLEVLDMVMYGRYAHRRFLEKETEEDLAICRRFLEEVGLKGYENRSFFSLSGGEKNLFQALSAGPGNHGVGKQTADQRRTGGGKAVIQRVLAPAPGGERLYPDAGADQGRQAICRAGERTVRSIRDRHGYLGEILFYPS